ncbi:hypothetical protein [Mesorhizobium sp. WSM3224]|uniref:hypothetical protein n=1 Tax=Mesorhizobium sp. WSM3224 TaxID=1040986 RepID=UPI0012EC1E6D|nr:hypothetical protein [Mesorhizobium sp. WSM3224]
MIDELQVPILSTGAATLVTEDHLDQIPVQTPMIRPEPLHQFGNVQGRLALADEAVHRQARSGLQLLA